MSREVVISVFKTNRRANPYDPFHSIDVDYERVTRRYSTIEKQINNLYKKIQKARENGFEPTHLVINELDYRFFSGYHKYVLHETYYSSPFGEQFKTIFGLKVLITQTKRPSVAWEP